MHLGPVHTYPDIFESATFSFRIGLPPTRIQRIRQRIRKKINPLSREEKYIRNECDNVWTGESGYFRIRLRKKRVQSLTEQKTNMPVNLKACVGRTEQISRHHLALRRMLWRHLSAEEPWVLEWIRIPSGTCGGANSIWIRYVWTGKFLNPERKSCGFKNIRIRVDGALVIQALSLASLAAMPLKQRNKGYNHLKIPTGRRQTTIMDKSVRTKLHLWRFWAHARREYNFTFLSLPSLSYNVEN